MGPGKGARVFCRLGWERWSLRDLRHSDDDEVIYSSFTSFNTPWQVTLVLVSVHNLLSRVLPTGSDTDIPPCRVVLLFCSSSVFYLMDRQSFLMPVFLQAMKPNYASLYLLIFPCLSCLPTFPLMMYYTEVKKNCPDLVSFVGVCCADRSDVCRTLAVTTLLAVVVWAHWATHITWHHSTVSRHWVVCPSWLGVYECARECEFVSQCMCHMWSRLS